LPSGELPIDAPPTIPQPSATRWQQYLMVLPMLAGTAATAMMFGGREGGGAYTYVVGGIFGLSTLGMLIMNWGGANAPRKAELMNARRDYLRYLAGVRVRVRATIADQRLALAYRHPDPQTLWSHAMGPRVWERRATDADFGVVRVGLGPQALAAPLVPPTVETTTELEPVTAGALHRFLTTYSVVDDMPVSIAVQAFTTVLVVGDGEESHAAAGGRRALVRAIIGQLATFHAPDDLLVACVCAAGSKDWDWLNGCPTRATHPGRMRSVTGGSSSTRLPSLTTCSWIWWANVRATTPVPPAAVSRW
jgi:S-DNA-T family DNA segregation ATPase FtsK/SpoIIIE